MPIIASISALPLSFRRGARGEAQIIASISALPLSFRRGARGEAQMQE